MHLIDYIAVFLLTIVFALVLNAAWQYLVASFGVTIAGVLVVALFLLVIHL